MLLSRCPGCARRLFLNGARFQSTAASDTASSPLMSKIRGDLKTAMRAKDTARLNVLRSIITEVNNASKTQSPVRTDLQLLSLIQKKRSLAQDASNQFKEAKREDLQAKEDAQAGIMDEYIGQVEVMAEEDIAKVVNETIESMKSTVQNLKPGLILQKLFGAGGALEGKPVEKKTVAQTVSRLLQQ